MKRSASRGGAPVAKNKVPSTVHSLRGSKQNSSDSVKAGDSVRGTRSSSARSHSNAAELDSSQNKSTRLNSSKRRLDEQSDDEEDEETDGCRPKKSRTGK